jgi:hypothetical protein
MGAERAEPSRGKCITERRKITTVSEQRDDTGGDLRNVGCDPRNELQHCFGYFFFK